MKNSPDWEYYIQEGNAKALLSEAGYFLDSYEDTVSLESVTRKTPTNSYDTCLGENQECMIRKVTNDKVDTIIIYAKVDPDRVHSLWKKTPKPIDTLQPDMQQLISEHIQDAFWKYPNGIAPIPGYPNLLAQLDAEQHAYCVYAKGTDPQQGERCPFDYTKSVEQNLRSYAENLREYAPKQTAHNHRMI